MSVSECAMVRKVRATNGTRDLRTEENRELRQVGSCWVTQQCNMSPPFYTVYWPEEWWNSQFSVFSGLKMQLTGQNQLNEHA